MQDYKLNLHPKQLDKCKPEPIGTVVHLPSVLQLADGSEAEDPQQYQIGSQVLVEVL